MMDFYFFLTENLTAKNAKVTPWAKKLGVLCVSKNNKENRRFLRFKKKLPNTYILFGIFLFIIGCGQVDYDYKTENAILDCFYKFYADNDIDIKSSVDSIENVLIKHKILKDKTGKSYISVLEQIRDGNLHDFQNADLISDINSIFYIPSSVSCNSLTESVLSEEEIASASKLNQLNSIFDTIRSKGNVSATLIADEILEILEAKDFENDFYRTLGLVSFCNLLKMSALPADNTSNSQSAPPLDERNVLHIVITSDDKIFVGNLPVEITYLKDVVKEFILQTADQKELDLPLIGKQKSSKATISVQNEDETSYEFYVSVQNELLAAYDEIRSQYSQEFFNSNFDNLEAEQKDAIKTLVPLRIVAE